MKRSLFNILMTLALLTSMFAFTAAPVRANPPAPEAPGEPTDTGTGTMKGIDNPNLADYFRNQQRWQLLEAGQTAQANALGLTGTDRVLVIMVEFGGTDVFTWTPGSTWDPLGRALESENTNVLGDCSRIITQTRAFTYTGPLHNQIERPVGVNDRSAGAIWTSDFNKTWFQNMLFGNGVVISYTMQDGTPFSQSFVGKSVTDYYKDFSSSQYTITGDVVGWVQVPHSTWWYDADECPGARSGQRNANRGAIPDAGSAGTLVRDALSAVNAISNTIPGFNWANYDRNGDGIIDRLWIVHAGYGEEDSTTLLNRTDYGEAAVWSHSSTLSTPYSVTAQIAAGPYIMMPENGGMGVFAHEYAHNLGAGDLYAYNGGETSAGFWTLMADDWVGYPVGFQPQAPDPLHLDMWGWLNPYVITDTSKVYTVTLGQASKFPGGTNVYRSVKILLPTGQAPQSIQPWNGQYYWWGGKNVLLNAMMTTNAAVTIPTTATMATLSAEMVYDTEYEWDFLWTQVSTDTGTTWTTITNTNSVCSHANDWIGGAYDMDNACGFTGANPSTPAPDTETFDLSAFKGESILVRFWYMTDWGTNGAGPFIDNVAVTVDGTPLFSDDAENGDAKWTYEGGMARNSGLVTFSHNYYFQWRNINANGGYDSSLSDSRWYYGPANTGLTAWYNNNLYTDNEVAAYMQDFPGFGPKGQMLIIDSHPEPYRTPEMVAFGYNNEGGNTDSRASMRDATFTLSNTVGFTMTTNYPYTPALRFTHYYTGKSAVNTFNDSLGYYPGAEFVSRGPGYDPISMKWVTKQWDTSVVVPSQSFYGIKAPGYIGTGTAQEQFRYDCASTDEGHLGCNWVNDGDGLGYDGGNGNPADYNGQYGWKVEVIEEAADHSWAKLRISNTGAPYAATATNSPFHAGGANLTYNVSLNNSGTITQTRAVTITLDPALTVITKDVRLQGANPYTWTGEMLAGTHTSFNLVAAYTLTETARTFTTTVDHNDFMNAPQTTPLITRVSTMKVYLPLVLRNFTAK